MTVDAGKERVRGADDHHHGDQDEKESEAADEAEHGGDSEARIDLAKLGEPPAIREERQQEEYRAGENQERRGHDEGALMQREESGRGVRRDQEEQHGHDDREHRSGEAQTGPGGDSEESLALGLARRCSWGRHRIRPLGERHRLRDYLPSAGLRAGPEDPDDRTGQVRTTNWISVLDQARASFQGSPG